MLCPHCPDTLLTMADRQGIEIDYCPKCRGIWLDRGELDKLLDRAAGPSPAAAAAPQHVAPPPPPQQQPYGYRQDHDDSKYGYQYGGKRKKSWLSEIFD